MAMSLTLQPALPPQNLADIQEGMMAGDRQQQQQHLRQIPAFFSVANILPTLPLGWEEHTHPQGITTFSYANNLVLTHNDPQLPAHRERLELAFTNIEALLPPQFREYNVQIVLSFTEEQFRQKVVQYYLVDYTAKQISWVSPVDVRAIGLQPMAPACRRSMLLRHFWTHVHHFPFTTAIDDEVETQRLMDTLNLGSAPGFGYLIPWTQGQCALLEKALQVSTSGPSQYRMAILGRLNTILAIYQHGLRWDIHNNPRLAPRRIIGPAVGVPRRGHADQPVRFCSFFLLLVFFLLLSALMILEGFLVIRDQSADLITFILTTFSSLLFFLAILASDTLQRLDARFPDFVARRPWLSLCFISLASFDLGVYALLLDGMMQLLVNDSAGINNDRMVRAILELVLPLMLSTFALGVGLGTSG